MSVRILIVDEQSVYRTGLRELIAAKVPCVEVIEASTLQALSCELRSNTFDLVLVCAGLSNSAALDTLKAGREALPATRLAIVSASDTRADILAGLAAGFHGYISKRQSDTEILDAITHLLSGRIYVPPSFAEAGDNEASASQGDREAAPFLSSEADLSKLTKRQREVLQLCAGHVQQGDRAHLAYC